MQDFNNTLFGIDISKRAQISYENSITEVQPETQAELSDAKQTDKISEKFNQISAAFQKNSNRSINFDFRKDSLDLDKEV